MELNKISNNASQVLASNVAGFRQETSKFQPIQSQALSKGLVITDKGEVKTEKELNSPFLLKIVSFFDKIVPSLGDAIRIHFLHVRSKASTATGIIEWIGRINTSSNKNPTDQAIAANFNAALRLQEFNPKTTTDSLAVIKQMGGFREPENDEEFQIQHKGVKDLLKLSLINDLLRLEFGGPRRNTYFAATLDRCGHAGIMDYRKLLEEVDSLMAKLPEESRKDVKRAITTHWIKMEAGHEWGIPLIYSVKGGNFTGNFSSQGAFQYESSSKASLLISNYIKQKMPTSLGSKSQERVRKAAFNGAEAAHAFNSRLGGHTEFPLMARLSPLLKRYEIDEIGKKLYVELNQNGVTTVPSGWYRHAVGMTIHKAADGKFYLYYCNRGGRAFERSKDRALMAKQESKECDMIRWEIGSPDKLTPELLGRIVVSGDKGFIEGYSGIYKILGLKNGIRIPKTPQKMGNCTWANSKGAIHAAAIAAAYDELWEKNKDPLQIYDAIEKGTAFFKGMERFGREESLEPLLDFDAHLSGGLQTTDHLKILSEAAKKLRTKALDASNDKAIRQGDTRMFKRVVEGLQGCPYPIKDCDTGPQKSAGYLEIHKSKLLQAGHGAFIIVENRCYCNRNNKIVEVPCTDPDQPLGAFMKQNGLRYPMI